MTKILLVLLWPAGIAAIAGIAALLAARALREALAAAPAPPPPRREAGRRRAAAAARQSALSATFASVARLGGILVAGSAVVYAVMTLVGLIVVHAGPAIDEPVFHWTVTHQIHFWEVAMGKATQIGNTLPTRAAAVTAAVCLAVTWRRMRWLPPVALGSLMVLHRVLIYGLHNAFDRPGPPGSGGTFPSGGSERAIVFYGLIVYLLWREFSGSRRAAIWAGAVVAMLGFNEGYSRGYLALHWLTDILAGLCYGCLLLLVFITAVRLVAGPARAPAGSAAPPPAPEPAAGTHPRGVVR